MRYFATRALPLKWLFRQCKEKYFFTIIVRVIIMSQAIPALKWFHFYSYYLSRQIFIFLGIFSTLSIENMFESLLQVSYFV